MSNIFHKLIFVAALILLHGVTADAANRHYPASRPPLKQTSFVALPLGAVKPAGWLKDQLTIQANGLTGHLDEFWPSLLDSAWKGGAGEGWERGPYYLDGLVPLAYLLDDPKLQAKARPFLEWTLASRQPDGWFGPAKNKDRWPLAVALKVLMQYHEATGDPRVLPLMTRYFRYIKDTPPDWPDKDWRGVRAMENAVAAYWLYNRTGDADILAAADSIRTHSFDWTAHYLNFPYTFEALQRGIKPNHLSHVVNNAMAIKHPGVWWELTGDERYRKGAGEAIRVLDEYHGQVAGRFGGDEHLCGRNPTQGTELCAVVEYMFSLEILVEIFGDAAFADRLEMLAYNANPGTCTPDYWAHQYDQQANQVLVSIAKRHWSTNGDTSNLYGLEPNYGCCTANMHQGWPKFVSHMWMATQDNGLAAIAYGPCRVTAKVADGAEATVTEATDYPFDGVIRFEIRVEKPTKFPLHLRIPAWAGGATVDVPGVGADGDTPALKAGAFTVINREWRSGDAVTLRLPMKLRTETRYNDAVSILRGPLYFSLRIGERFRKLDTLKLDKDVRTIESLRQTPGLEKLVSFLEKTPMGDYAIEPTTPWNYALIVDRDAPEKSITVNTRKPGKVPFAQAAAPVVLRVRGKAVPEWTLVDNSAGETPRSPVVSNEPVTELELIPYGCTRLRITEFPVVR
ncbi:MAG: beta-L-arabinofuranosidase domain-containing protein [Phycisphaerae bacterium]